MKSHPKHAVEQGFEQDRLDYWAMRDELLAKYSGKWVAVHKGRVVAVGDDPVSIMEQALSEEGYAYSNKVGEEDKIVIRQRRVSFPYDDTQSVWGSGLAILQNDRAMIIWYRGGHKFLEPSHEPS